MTQLTPGRLIFAAEETEAKFQTDEERALPSRLVAARVAGETQIIYESNWLQNKGIQPTRPDAPKVDAQADIIVTSLYEPVLKASQVLEPVAGDAPDDEEAREEAELKQWATGFIAGHFAEQGAATITAKPYEEQLALMKRLDAALALPENQHAVNALGLRPYARRLTRILPHYRAALTRIGVRAVSYEEVLEIRKASHEAASHAVVGILNLPTAAARARLMGPFHFQLGLMAKARAEKRAMRDVDPKSGKETDAPVLELPEETTESAPADHPI